MKKAQKNVLIVFGSLTITEVVLSGTTQGWVHP